MSLSFTISSSLQNTVCYVDNYGEHKSIILLKSNTALANLVLKNININLNVSSSKKEDRLALWRLILNPTIVEPPALDWIDTHVSSGVQYITQTRNILIGAASEVLVSGYISDTLTINVDTILLNRIFAQDDVLGISIEYVGSQQSRRTVPIGAVGSLTWAEGTLPLSPSEIALDAATTAMSAASVAITDAANTITTASTTITTSITTAADTITTASTAMIASATNITTSATNITSASNTMTIASGAITTSASNISSAANTMTNASTNISNAGITMTTAATNMTAAAQAIIDHVTP